MKQLRIKNIFVLTAFALAVPVTILAQEDGKTDKEKSNKDKTERRHITITTKGDQQEKITVEINGEKVTVNGKPIEEYKDKDGDISVNVRTQGHGFAELFPYTQKRGLEFQWE